MSGSIAPDSTGLDGMYRGLGNSKVSGNINLPFALCDAKSDSPNLIKRENCASVTLALGATLGMCPSALIAARGCTSLADHIDHVVGMGAHEQMVTPYAPPVIASVEDEKSLRDRSYLNLVGKPVSRDELLGDECKKPVSGALGDTTLPLPAIYGFADLDPESFDCFGGKIVGHWEVPFLVSRPRNLAVRGGISASILPPRSAEMRV